MRRSVLRCAGSAAALGVLLIGVLVAPTPVGAGAGIPVTRTPIAPGSGPCGGERPAGNWTCSFDEEFNGTSLNRHVWTVQTTASYGFHSGAECFVDSSRNVWVSGGALNLRVLKTASPFTCASPHGSYRTQYTSGSVYTAAFDQVYGRFEIRARFPEGGGRAGLHSALWLYPRYTPGGSAAGPSEIDVAEAYSRYPSLVMPTVHSHGGGTHNCDVADYGAGFHTYAAEWTPSAVTFYYDGQPCFRVAPGLFAGRGVRTTTPFFVALTQALGIRPNAMTSATPLPATMQIDYVRVWK